MDVYNIKIYEKGDSINGDKFMYYGWHVDNTYVIYYNNEIVTFDGDKFMLFIKTNKFILECY